MRTMWTNLICLNGFIHNGGFHKYITRLLTIISQNKETVYHHLWLRTNRYVSEKLFDQMNELWSAHHMNEGLKFSAEYVQIATVGMTRSLLPLFGMTELSASRKKRTPRAGEFFLFFTSQTFSIDCIDNPVRLFPNIGV